MALGHLHGIIQTRLVARLGTVIGIVELIEVEIVGLEVVQGDVQVFPELLHRGGTRLGGNHHLVPATRKGLAYFLLAIGIEACRVVIVNPIVVSFS